MGSEMCIRDRIELLGLECPSSVEGTSLLDSFSDPDLLVRDAFLYAYKDFQRSARDRRMKLIEYTADGGRNTQLFDLEKDPWETRNLVGEEKHSEDIRRLRVQLDRWHTEFDDPTEPWWNG